MEKVMRKVPKEGRTDEFYVLLTEWNEDSLSLTLIDNDVAWAGEMDSTKVEKICDTMRKKKEEYIVELKHALLDGEKDFTFFIENTTFVVKKTDHKSDIKVKFCFIQLHEIPLMSTYSSLLCGVLDQEKRNRSFISNLAQEVQYLKLEREDLKMRLEQFSSEKATLEAILYSKFSEVLNTKKEKITSLESQGATGDSLPIQHSVKSTHNGNTNTNEQNLQKSAEATKRTSQNYAAAKRKCLTVDSSEEPSNLDPREDVSSSNALPTTSSTGIPELNHQNLNYDSETDIDTDDESPSDTFTGSIKSEPLSSDTPERDSKRILPKRVCSSSSKCTVLPKRVHNSSSVKSSNSKIGKEKSVIPSISSKEICDEFNSQSLLADY